MEERVRIYPSLGLGLLVLGASTSYASLPLHQLKLPPGFSISVYAEGVEEARAMALSPEGTLYVGSMGDKVFALPDADGDGKADEVITVARGLQLPVGVDYKDGDLYVSSIDRIVKLPGIERRLKAPPSPVLVSAKFPPDRAHGWKFIKFGPDGLLYVPVGAPCNICERADSRYSSIMRMRPDGSRLEVFAHGVRNSVGFDWHPQTKELWFTENGRDRLGDDLPPDELNRAAAKGMHFGFPYCHGRGILDPQFGQGKRCQDFVPAAMDLGPHVAALGMRFYAGSMFPSAYRGRIFIAEHGSWNRSSPVGYRITTVRLQGDQPVEYKVFAEGWLQGPRAWGRPADVLVRQDGSLLVSDDEANAIYRISYSASE
jgi:glucose/arabinose dehydrogenase